MVIGQGALAGLRLADRDSRVLDEAAQRVIRLAVMHAAAGDEQRLPAGADRRHRALEGADIRAVARDVPDAALEQRFGIGAGHRLHILGQAQRDRPGFRRRGEHAHGFGQRRDELLRAVDAVPVARDRPEAVVDGEILRVFAFKLLQHRGLDALGEDIAGEQQHGQAVDGGDRGAGDHVGGAGAD